MGVREREEVSLMTDSWISGALAALVEASSVLNTDEVSDSASMAVLADRCSASRLRDG